jgi:hypothetical protein
MKFVGVVFPLIPLLFHVLKPRIDVERNFYVALLTLTIMKFALHHKVFIILFGFHIYFVTNTIALDNYSDFSEVSLMFEKFTHKLLKGIT